MFELTPQNPVLLDGTGRFQLVAREGSVCPGTSIRVLIEVILADGAKVRIITWRLSLSFLGEGEEGGRGGEESTLLSNLFSSLLRFAWCVLRVLYV